MSDCLNVRKLCSTRKALTRWWRWRWETLLCGRSWQGPSGAAHTLAQEHHFWELILQIALQVTNTPHSPFIAAMAVTEEDWERPNNSPSKGAWLNREGFSHIHATLDKTGEALSVWLRSSSQHFKRKKTRNTQKTEDKRSLWRGEVEAGVGNLTVYSLVASAFWTKWLLAIQKKKIKMLIHIEAFHVKTNKQKGFPDSAGGKEPACQCRRYKRHEFDPWLRKIPWRKGHGNPLQYSFFFSVFLSRESHG